MIHTINEKKREILILGLVLLSQLIIYLPNAGTGFIKDDFIWLDNVVTEGKVDYLKPFTISTGFYRPLVSVTFGIQYVIFGMNSVPYGLFNLFIHLLNIIIVYLLLSSFKPFKPYALLVTILFSFNVKSISMAVGWISGRTTLLFAFFTLLSLLLYQKARLTHIQKQRNIQKYLLYLFVGLFYFAALLSKESAIVLPLFIFIYSFFYLNERKKINCSGILDSILKRFIISFKSVFVFFIPVYYYFILRLQSDAFSPHNSPEDYHFTITPLEILKNGFEYLIRSGLFDLLIAFWLLFVVLFYQKKINIFKDINNKIIVVGVLGFSIFLLPVLFLSVRSDLYVYMPQIGFHLVFAVLISQLWKELDIKGEKKSYYILTPILILSLIWFVLHFNKASSYAKEGNVSTTFTRELISIVPNIKKGSYLYIFDLNTKSKYSPSNTISYGFPSHQKLYYFYPYKKLSGEIIPPEGMEKIKRVKKVYKFFFWKDRQLKGPFDCKELRDLIGFIWLKEITLPNIEFKIFKKKKTLGKFQKRKLWKKNYRKQKRIRKKQVLLKLESNEVCSPQI